MSTNKPEIGTYTDKNGVVHKYVGSLADYHNAHLMALMLNEADTDPSPDDADGWGSCDMTACNTDHNNGIHGPGVDLYNGLCLNCHRGD